MLVVLIVLLGLSGMPLSVNALSRPTLKANPTPTNAPRIALIRLEDVGPWYALDPRRLEVLRYVADYLALHHMPFQVAMTPVYLDPSAGIRIGIDMPDDPRVQQFIATIHYMISKGGVIGLQGYTHQMGDGITGISAEFSNDPHTIESTEPYMASRVNAALAAAKEVVFPSPSGKRLTTLRPPNSAPTWRAASPLSMNRGQWAIARAFRFCSRVPTPLWAKSVLFLPLLVWFRACDKLNPSSHLLTARTQKCLPLCSFTRSVNDYHHRIQ